MSWEWLFAFGLMGVFLYLGFIGWREDTLAWKRHVAKRRDE